jgi:hypothetical protein
MKFYLILQLEMTYTILKEVACHASVVKCVYLGI